MLLVRGRAGGSALTGTIYEPGEDVPSFRGSPETDAPYVWICDEFYEVSSGGSTQVINDQELQIAFDTPLPKGFDDRQLAIEAAKDHIRTQFVRIGVPADEVELSLLTVTDEGDEVPLEP